METSFLKVFISLSIPDWQNAFGICPSTFMLLQMAQMITSKIFSPATLHHIKFTPRMIFSTYNLAFYIPHRWMLITPPSKWIEWRYFTQCTTIHLYNTTSNTPIQLYTWFRASNMPTLNSSCPIIWITATLNNVIFVKVPYENLMRSKNTLSSLPSMQTRIDCIVMIEYMQCVEWGATKCAYGHTFNLLYSDWMVNKLDNREPSQEEKQTFNHFLRLQPHCNGDLYPRALAACFPRDPEFLAFFRDPDNRTSDHQFEYQT